MSSDKKITVNQNSYDLKYASKVATPVFEYKLPFGKYRNQTFLQIPQDQRQSYIKWLTSKARNVTSIYATSFLLGHVTIGPMLEDSVEQGVLTNPFFLLFGKFRGIPLQFVENESPGYCKYLLSSDFGKNLDDDLRHVLENFVSN